MMFFQCTRFPMSQNRCKDSVMAFISFFKTSVYHCKCIDPWLTGGKKSCPVCNRPVIVARKHKSRQPNSAPSTSSTGNSPPPDDENEAQSEMEQDEDINERTPLISGSTRRPRGAGAMDV